MASNSSTRATASPTNTADGNGTSTPWIPKPQNRVCFKTSKPPLALCDLPSRAKRASALARAAFTRPIRQTERKLHLSKMVGVARISASSTSRQTPFATSHPSTTAHRLPPRAGRPMGHKSHSRSTAAAAPRGTSPPFPQQEAPTRCASPPAKPTATRAGHPMDHPSYLPLTTTASSTSIAPTYPTAQ